MRVRKFGAVGYGKLRIRENVFLSFAEEKQYPLSSLFLFIFRESPLLSGSSLPFIFFFSVAKIEVHERVVVASSFFFFVFSVREIEDSKG